MPNSKKLRILMLEDSAEDAGLIERVLLRDNFSFVTERVDAREEFDHAIRNFSPDVVLSDHGLPQFNSLEALKICLKERAFAPFILVTGTVSEEFAATCLKLGADDYILKSNLSRLPSAIHRALKERKLAHLKREARRALRKQNEELLRVNQELDRFVYSVSHNLRAPLTSVLGLLNLARHEDVSKKLLSIHDMMGSSIQRLDETLKEIIDYSRNARNAVELENTNMLEVVHAAIGRLAYLDAQHQITWMIDVRQEVHFTTDKNRLEVVVHNLLSNAMQYLDSQREPVISVNAQVTEHGASIVIKDNGIGIKENTLPKVFDMFYRGTELSQGAGLGLYVVREIVKRLRGSVNIDSEFNRGTTVTVIIPNGQTGDHSAESSG
jgi:signal transduction histidine kinase